MAIAVTSMESALELCRRGLCAVFLPAFLVAVHNQGQPRARQLAEYPAPAALGPVTRRVHVVHRDGDAGDAEHQHRAGDRSALWRRQDERLAVHQLLDRRHGPVDFAHDVEAAPTTRSCIRVPAR